MKSELEQITKQNDKLANEYNLFINSIQDKLLLSKVNVPFANDKNIVSPKNKKSSKRNNINIFTQTITSDLVSKISSIVLLNNELYKKLTDITGKNTEYKTRYNQIAKENAELKTKMTYNDQSMSEQITELQNSKQSELSKQKQVLYEKIKSLTNLLEESNRLIKSYETEVTQLKNKNNKLEYNLKMLTESHSELEKIINNDNSGLKNELELKEQNNNELLKELQIKDLHITKIKKCISYFSVNAMTFICTNHFIYKFFT